MGKKRKRGPSMTLEFAKQSLSLRDEDDDLPILITLVSTNERDNSCTVEPIEVFPQIQKERGK